MHGKLMITLCLISIVFCSVSAAAMEFHHIGYEAISMGGAGVASSRNTYAAYYNPALLPEHKHTVNVSFSAMYGLREVDFVEHIDNLADIDISKLIDDVSASYPGGSAPESVAQNVSAIKYELRSLSDQNGFQMTPSISLGVQVGNFGFGAFMVTEGTASAVIDSNRLDLIFEANGEYIEYDEIDNAYALSTENEYRERSVEYAIKNGLTYVYVDGLAYMEIPIAYGHRFNTEMGNINVGAAFKIMPGYTFESILDIDTEVDNIIDNWKDYYEEDTSFGIDLGVLYKPSMLENLSIGLVTKNLNTPKFETVSGREIKVKPLVRVGFAYDAIFDRLTVALDADLTRNETFIDDYYSQYIGGGVNFHPLSWLSLRAGIAQNIQERDEGTLLTGGLGIGSKWLQMDIAGQYGTKSGTYNNGHMPRVAKLQITLISKWN